MTMKFTPIKPCVADDIKIGHRYIAIRKSLKLNKPQLFLFELVSVPSGSEGQFEAICHEYNGKPYSDTSEVERITLREIGCPACGEWHDIDCRTFRYSEEVYAGIKYLRENHSPSIWPPLFASKKLALSLPKMESVIVLPVADLLGTTAQVTIFSPSY